MRRWPWRLPSRTQPVRKRHKRAGSTRRPDKRKSTPIKVRRSTTMISRHTLILGLLVCGGCASTVPRELADARVAYQRAASGPAARENPAQLHVAQEALTVAEKTFDDEGDSDKARDRAYVATRKAELAEVQADIAQ